MWLGVDVRDDLNAYIACIEVDLSKASTIIRRVAEWLLGAHNHYHFRLSVTDCAIDDCRTSYFTKDLDGDSIVKCKYLRF